MARSGNKFKMGIAGCGRISQAYIDAIRSCEGVALTAVMDVKEEKARAAAEAADARAFTDVDSFVEEGGLDGAIVCAPPSFHREITEALLHGGVNVLCEKPFATRYDDCVAMADMAEETDLTLMMASKFRYAEDVIRAKALIASGMLGEVLFYDNCFSGTVDMRGRWNSNPEVAGGGVLIDNGTHSVDIVRYLIGPIRRVFAFEGKRVSGLPVEDTVTLSFITDANVMGTIRLSWSIQVDSATYIDVCGTEGAMRVGWQGSEYQHTGHPHWVPFGVGYDKIGAFKNQVTNFIGAIHGVEDPLITMEEGLASVAVIDAAYRSLEAGAWADVEEHPSTAELAVVK